GRRAVGRAARWDIRLVHLGAVALLVDVVSLLIPRAGAEADASLRAAGLATGVLGATAMVAGLCWMCARGLPGRHGYRRAPTVMDWMTIGLLFTVLSFGLWEAI